MSGSAQPKHLIVTITFGSLLVRSDVDVNPFGWFATLESLEDPPEGVDEHSSDKGVERDDLSIYPEGDRSVSLLTLRGVCLQKPLLDEIGQAPDILEIKTRDPHFKGPVGNDGHQVVVLGA